MLLKPFRNFYEQILIKFEQILIKFLTSFVETMFLVISLLHFFFLDLMLILLTEL